MASFLRQAIMLCKPRVVALLVLTGAAGAWKAADGSPHALTLFTVIAAGAFPPLIGAAAVSGEITAAGLYMFAFVFFWTPPHFWTLSMLLREDYAAANVPMLAVVAEQRDTARQVLLYVALLAAMSWLPLVAGYGGLTFAIVTTLLSLNWLRMSLPLLAARDPAQTLAAYKYSLLYLALVFGVLAVEPMLPWYG